MINLIILLNAFGENLLKTYDKQDATLEILIMLIFAMLLGFLLRHWIGFRKKEFIIEQGATASTTDANDNLTAQIERLRIEIDRLKGVSHDASKETILKSQAKGKGNGNSDKPKQETTTLGEISALASLKSEVNTAENIVSSTANEDKIEKKSEKKKRDAYDDLKIIEGIGPALEKLLNSNGINTFSDLANSTIPQLEEMLDKAGPRFRVHVPETWPEQATLLRDGKMEEFQALTANLKGGRRV